MPYDCEPPLSLAFISTNKPFHILFLLFLFLVLLLQNMIVYMRITVHSYHPPPFLDLPCPKLRIRGHSRNPLASSFSRIDLPFFSNNSRPVGFVDTTFSFTFISSSNLAFQAANDSGVTGVPQFFGCSCISTFACSSAFYGGSTPMQRPRRQRHPQPPSRASGDSSSRRTWNPPELKLHTNANLHVRNIAVDQPVFYDFGNVIYHCHAHEFGSSILGVNEE